MSDKYAVLRQNIWGSRRVIRDLLEERDALVAAARNAPAVPAEMSISPYLTESEQGYRAGWNDCREEMLDKLQETTA